VRNPLKSVVRWWLARKLPIDINGVGPENQNAERYRKAAKEEF